jgi:hypothetical protein
MTGLSALWVPIVVSGVIVFLVSSIIHMVMPWHKGDYPAIPNEDRFRDAVRPLAIPPGDYMVPRPKTAADLKSPEFAEKMAQGPVMIITVRPNGLPGMGSQLGMWFVYLLVVGLFAGYVASRALAPGADYLEVFRFVGVTAFLGYGAALWQISIWYHRSWSTTFKSTVDGLIYALLTAGTFGWLWPR